MSIRKIEFRRALLTFALLIGASSVRAEDQEPVNCAQGFLHCWLKDSREDLHAHITCRYPRFASRNSLPFWTGIRVRRVAAAECSRRGGIEMDGDDVRIPGSTTGTYMHFLPKDCEELRLEPEECLFKDFHSKKTKRFKKGEE